LAVHRRASESDLLFDPTELCMELAGLDPTQLETLGNRLVALIASYLHTDRVSLALFNSSTGEIVAAGRINVHASRNGTSRASDRSVRSERRPLLAYDLRELSEILSPWAANLPHRRLRCLLRSPLANRVIGCSRFQTSSTST